MGGGVVKQWQFLGDAADATQEQKLEQKLLKLEKEKVSLLQALTMEKLLLFLIVQIDHSLRLMMDFPIAVTIMKREIMILIQIMITLIRKMKTGMRRTRIPTRILQILLRTDLP